MAEDKKRSQKNILFRFDGFDTPHYTQVPDQLFDELLPKLSGAELKVLLYICRRTFGFKKECDNISLNQMLNGIMKKDGTRLDGGVGLSKPTLLRALRTLKARRIIIHERRRDDAAGNQATNYRLNVRDPLGQKMNQGEGQNFTKPLGSEIDQEQDTVNQETEAALVAALLNFGIDKPTVDRLVKTYDAELIAQKIDYVVFMQEEQPNLVRNPRGWLLKAIEQDYGPPAGYQPRAKREALKAQVGKRQEETEKAAAEHRQAQQATLREKQLENERLLAAAQEAYQTTATEIRLWQDVLRHLRQLAGDTSYALIKDAQLLTTNDGTAIIGTVNALSARWLRTRLQTDLPAVFDRCGQPVEVIQVVHLTPEQP